MQQHAGAGGPVAVVGVACRFPAGIASPEDLWDLVVRGGEAISSFPSDRGWDLDLGLAVAGGGRGGFLADAADFDAPFFGVSSREALAMDPQQRLLLEVSWEALERARWDPSSLRGSDTGVFFGLTSGDYWGLLQRSPDDLDAYLLTGAAGAAASGRVAHVLGLEGPAVSLDTAASSSLVALHMACQSLRAGECSLALAGGASVMATASWFRGFAQQGGLAADGRCKPFSAAADGTVWSEGVGVLVLARLADALRLGLRVWGVVRGSAVNQDGASGALAAPRVEAQERVIRLALAASGLAAADVDAVEAHGTGTVVGDPVEARALLAAYGQGREVPLWLGSVKSNLGHTQAAAGVAGVIKTLMALRHGVLPATLHVDEPSPHVDWSSGLVSLLTEPRPWEPGGRVRRAGVSSFGISGTNAHVVLEEAPHVGGPGGGAGPVRERRPTSSPPSPSRPDGPQAAYVLGHPPRRPRFSADPPLVDEEKVGSASSRPHLPSGGGEGRGGVDGGGGSLGSLKEEGLYGAEDLQRRVGGGVDAAVGVVPLVVSGGSVGGLRGQAARLAGFVREGSDLSLRDVGWALVASRAALGDRSVVVAGDRGAAVAALAGGERASGVVSGRVVGGGVGFVFSGQGAQRVGMGRGLYEAFPVFAGAFDEVCGLLDAELGGIAFEDGGFGGRSLRPVVLGSGLDGEGGGRSGGGPGGFGVAVGSGDGGSVSGRSAAGSSGAVGLSLVDETVFAQCGLFAVEVALARLLGWVGVRPDVVVGHSVGEIVAAHVAGVLSLGDACRLVGARGRLMQALPGGGAMVALDASEDQVAELLGGVGERVSIAAVNGPHSVVVSGVAAVVDDVAREWEGRGGRVRRVRVNRAFHSPLVEPMLDDFREVASSVDYRPPGVRLVSTVTGGVVSDEVCSAEYWVGQARRTVRFADAVRAVASEGVSTLVEVGPNGQLAGLAQATLDEARSVFAESEIVHSAQTEAGVGAPVEGVGVLRAGRDDVEAFLGGVGAAWVRGVPVTWDVLFAGTGAELVDLPTYAFQRERYWPTVGDSSGSLAGRPDLAGLEGSADGGDSIGLGARVVGSDVGARERALVGVVRGEAAAVLGRGVDAVDPRRSFKDLGFESQDAVELRNGLQVATGLRLPSTFVFDHPSCVAAAAELGRLLDPVAVSESGSWLEARTGLGSGVEPVAIVGMGCRFPGGVGSPEELWELVAEGRDAISGFPADRGWDALPGGMGGSFVRRGGFLDDVAGFDAPLFGVSPREALAMDPQQRQWLEVSWEALERAGLDPVSLRGTDTGVFVGLMAGDYGQLLQRGDVLGSAVGVEGYGLTGLAGSVVSGRVAYTLGLQGPAVTVDTACSSSLVALHMACQALRTGECSLALAGGVTVLGTPGLFVDFAAQGGLAGDGRCKAFSASADGTGWAEGVGVLVLARLSDAVGRGLRVWGVVRGSAVNQDGASNGLTAPSGVAQRRVIGQALAAGGLGPGDVDAVEAHGTGTALGDPIEAEALLAAYGQERDGPLWLGSVKSNLGHTQAAAGVAGVIKMLMALRHGVLPATLHVDEPSPHVDWSSGSVSLLTEPRPWESGGRVRRAGVSSFGISGTNAHVIVEEPPRADGPGGGAGPVTEDAGLLRRHRHPHALAGLKRPTSSMPPTPPPSFSADPPLLDEEKVGSASSRPHLPTGGVEGGGSFGGGRAHLPSGADMGRDGLDDSGFHLPFGEGVGVGGVVPLVVSGGSGEGVRGQGRRLAEFLRGRPELSVADVGWSLVSSRAALGHRAVVLAEGWEAGVRGLEAVGAGEPGAGVVVGSGERGSGGVVFVFSGQGAQWVGMAAELVEGSAVFRGAMEACEAAVAPFVDWSLLDVTCGGSEGAGGLLGRVDVVQPALFSVMVSLAALWESFGVAPSAVVGHSQGEVAAAYVAGALSLEDAARVVAVRSRLVARLSGDGGMVSVVLPEARVRDLVGRWASRVHVAAVNGPTSVTVSGEPGALDQLLAVCEADGVRASRIAVDYAAHSPQVEQVRDELLDELGGVAPRPSVVPFWSTVDGGVVDTSGLDAGYWYRNLREPVRFEPVVRGLAGGGGGGGLFVEVSPHPVLTPAVQGTLDEVGGAGMAVGTLRRDDGGPSRFVAALADAWVHGADVDWAPLFAGRDVRLVELPTYAFQHQRYWPVITPPADRGPEPALLVEEWEPLEQASPPAGVTWAVVGPDPLGVVDALTASDSPVEHHPDLASLAEAVERPDFVVIEAGLRSADDEADVVGIARDGCVEVLGRLQEWLAEERFDRSRLVVVTEQGVGTGDERGDVPGGPEGAAVWGLVRAAQAENPDCFVLVDVGIRGDDTDGDPEAGDESWRLLPVTVGSGESEVAVRGGQLWVRRLVRADQPRGAGSAGVFDPEGTVLVTGGTGTLGGVVARHLVARYGVRSLVLASRRGPEAPGVGDLVAQLEADGAEVSVVACDVADRVALGQLLRELPADRPLRGVVHTAGALDDGVVGALDAARFDTAWEPKAPGAWNLHQVTQELGVDLSAFVVFSSTAGTLGAAGQANYAAASTFLDALMVHRRNLGLGGLSIAWGLWDQASGLTGHIGDVDLARMRRTGVVPLSTSDALDLFDAALGGGGQHGRRPPVVVALNLDLLALGGRDVGGSGAPEAVPPLWRRLVGSDAARSASEHPGAAAGLTGPGGGDGDRDRGGLASRLAGLSEGERQRVLVDIVRAQAAAVLGHSDPEAVDTERAFKELGFDSLTAVELRNRLSLLADLRLPTTLVFDHPTVGRLSRELGARLLSEAASGEGAGAGPEELDPERQALRHLAGLEAALATLDRDDPVSAELRAGLQRALARLATADDPDGRQVEDELRAAGADEVLDFIDREFGKAVS